MALLLQLGKGDWACAEFVEPCVVLFCEVGGAGDDGRDGVGVLDGVVTGVLLGVGGVGGGLAGLVVADAV